MRSNLHLVRADARAEAAEPPSRQVRVLLAEPHAAMRRNLRLLLEAEPDLDVVAEVGELRAIMAQVRAHHAQVVVLDIGAPGGSWTQTIRRLRRSSPAVAVIAIGLHDAPSFRRAAIEAGAAAYVLKDKADSQLPGAIRAQIRPAASAAAASA